MADVRRHFIRHAWLQLVLLLAILAVVNHLWSQHFVRLDLTSDQVHTLRPSRDKRCSPTARFTRVFQRRSSGPVQQPPAIASRQIT